MGNRWTDSQPPATSYSQRCSSRSHIHADSVMDTNKFIASCTTYSMCQELCSRTVGKLHLLPVPSRPWSYVTLDFITDLPISQGYTVIMNAADWFAKYIKLILLPDLPTSFKYAKWLFIHVYRHFGIRVWTSFMEKLGVSLSLTLGYTVARLNGLTRRWAASSMPSAPKYRRTGSPSCPGLKSLQFPVRTWLPASSLPLEQNSYQSTCHQQLVPEEWAGLGASPPAPRGSSTMPQCAGGLSHSWTHTHWTPLPSSLGRLHTS